MRRSLGLASTSAVRRTALPAAKHLLRASPAMPASARVAQISRQLQTSAARMDATASAPATDLVKLETKQGLRVLTLNRPAKMNALNLEMIDVIWECIQKWNGSEAASCILLKGEGAKAFCAGGDVEALTIAAKEDATRKDAVHFFKQEYEADSFIAKIKKPIVTFMDGITMGGGVGLSAHATFRVATENTVFAMPETTIGLFPDVGASFMLSRLDGKIGLWLGLTSDRMTGYDCYRTGIATHYIPAERLPQLEARLAELDYPSAPQKATELVNTVLNEFQADEAMMSDLKCSVEGDKRRAIDFAFSKPSVLEILKALKSIEEGQQFAGKGLESWAKQTRETIEFRSPTSCTVALLGLKRGKDMDISSVFQMDMRIVCQCVDPAITTDFINGVDQVLVKTKKDKAERKKRAAWNPSTLQEVDVKQIESDFFDGPLRTKLPVPQLENVGQTYKEYPHIKYALPREEAIGKIIKGESGSSGSMAINSEKALLDILNREWNGKLGIKAKARDVLARRTTQDEDGNLKWSY